MAARRKDAGSRIERISGIQGEQDRLEMIEVIGRAFARPTWMEQHTGNLLSPPIYDPEHTRVVVVDGRVVAGTVMAPRNIRFGPVTVPAMTVGPVGTHDHYQKHGYGAAAMEDASRWMAEHGVLLGYLRGIRNFYHRFGYYPYMSRNSLTLRSRDIRAEARPGTLRVMRRKHVPALARIFEEATAGRAGVAVRDRRVWEWLVGPGAGSSIFRDPRVILDGRSRVCGYLTNANGEGVALDEIVVRGDEASCRAALGALAAEARRREEATISFPLPWDDAFAVFLRQQVSMQFRAETEPWGAMLLKIVDFPALMKALQPMFDERWRTSGARLPATRFTLSSEIGQVGIAASGRGVRVNDGAGDPTVRVPQRVLSGLLSGYYSVRDVAGVSGSAVPDELRATLDVLFPTGWPFAYRGDRY